MECEFCNKKFKSKGILKNHQNTAKYCLEIRKEINEQYKCEYCFKNLTSKFNLENHYDKCIEKKINLEKDMHIQKMKNDFLFENEKLKNELLLKTSLIEEQKESIKELQKQIKELASLAIDKPNTINNNHNLNNNSNNKMIDNRVLNMIPLDLSQENLKKTLEEKFTENHLINGQKGVAQFFVDHYLISEDQKYMFKCTDPSRKMFIYLDDEGKIHKDINALRFTKNISDPVIEVTHNMLNELPDKYPDDNERMDYATVKFMEIANIKNDNNEFIKNLIPPLIIKS